VPSHPPGEIIEQYSWQFGGGGGFHTSQSSETIDEMGWYSSERSVVTNVISAVMRKAACAMSMASSANWKYSDFASAPSCKVHNLRVQLEQRILTRLFYHILFLKIFLSDGTALNAQTCYPGRGGTGSVSVLGNLAAVVRLISLFSSPFLFLITVNNALRKNFSICTTLFNPQYQSICSTG
jgi:hypothetical protein